ncbi:uridylate-specific endoribonuclease C-like isoform X2 [Achroia grisella]|uniref:uridylate-specific endoribonuclease C-like isoform X2 n=1 Tax=Achroia grisella TaxID=688607 RepID=UPI0027D20596|nr:uridylate-specific endoribonuclease C-like isoform X2 [Achroia grisella]
MMENEKFISEQAPKNMKNMLNLLFGTLLFFNFSLVVSGREYNKQQLLNHNTDFLLHESNVNPTSPKRDYVTSQPNPQNTQISKQDFPPLKPTSATSPPPGVTVISTTKKQDFPPLRSPSATPPYQGIPQGSTRPDQTSSGKRDYVAPHYPSSNPTAHQSSGKVKDLINFYDNKDRENTPQKVPSYSNILQGTTNNKVTPSTTSIYQPVTQPNQKISTIYIPKPSSYSGVVSGHTSTSGTTFKPSSKGPYQSTFPVYGMTTVRPGSPILPSTLVNNNLNNRNNPTDTELQTLSEDLLRKDVNNAAKYITINFQEKTTGQSKEDRAPRPLFTITDEAWNIPTVQKILPLLDNYERDTLVNEHVTAQERNEENAFMDAIMSTTVIRHLMNFLKDKGYVTPDPRQQRDFLKQLWFGLYSRSRGKISSSGFEHVFVSELKNGEVSGLHNWIYFSKEETANRVNYLGYLKYTQLSDKGTVLKLHFSQQGVDKPVDSMFIGTSPELEIALYTLCFVTRTDNDCYLKLAGKDVNVITHSYRYRSKNFIGSAYPQI